MHEIINFNKENNSLIINYARGDICITAAHSFYENEYTCILACCGQQIQIKRDIHEFLSNDGDLFNLKPIILDITESIDTMIIAGGSLKDKTSNESIKTPLYNQLDAEAALGPKHQTLQPQRVLESSPVCRPPPHPSHTCCSSYSSNNNGYFCTPNLQGSSYPSNRHRLLYGSNAIESLTYVQDTTMPTCTTEEDETTSDLE